VKGIIGLNGIALPQALFDGIGPFASMLHAVGVTAESWSVQDFAKTTIWIFILMFVALACPNTLQIMARYEPALGVKPRPTKLAMGRILEWNASLPWAIAVSATAAIAIASVGGPSEFLYWQF
jgi:alginate O-acetyltransferase complex protein AlgI